jgi:hypothetical protein
VKSHQRYRDVGAGHLPGPDHLVAGGQAADAAVADADQESLVGHRRQTQHAIGGFLQIQRRGIEGHAQGRQVLGHARHARRLAKQRVHVHVDRIVVEMAVGHHQASFSGGCPDHREGATLAFANGRELVETARRNRQHVALLSFVAPDLGG